MTDERDDVAERDQAVDEIVITDLVDKLITACGGSNSEQAFEEVQLVLDDVAERAFEHARKVFEVPPPPLPPLTIDEVVAYYDARRRTWRAFFFGVDDAGDSLLQRCADAVCDLNGSAQEHDVWAALPWGHLVVDVFACVCYSRGAFAWRRYIAPPAPAADPREGLS